MVSVGNQVRSRTVIEQPGGKKIPKGLLGEILKETVTPDGDKQFVVRWALGNLEMVVFEDEVILVTPSPSPEGGGRELKVEIKTLVQIVRGTSIADSDTQFAEYLNAGWEVLNITITPETSDQFPTRFITLRREVAVDPPEPERVQVVEIKDTPTPEEEEKDPDSEPTALTQDWDEYRKGAITLEDIKARRLERVAAAFFDAMGTLNSQRRVMPQLLCEVNPA